MYKPPELLDDITPSYQVNLKGDPQDIENLWDHLPNLESFYQIFPLLPKIRMVIHHEC